MATEGSYNLSESQRHAEIERLAEQARSGWTKESRNLSLFGLADGMSVLELGSGPGFITSQLLSLVPNSHVTCVETDPALIDQAKQYLHGNASHKIRFVEGSVMDTPFEDNQFDFAYARFLFQHLPDPIGASREIRRVLKPGGKLVIYDIDDAIFGLFQPPLPELEPVVEAFGQAQKSRGGNRHIGRQLSDILSIAGYGGIDFEVLGSHSADCGIDSYLKHLSPDRMYSLVESGFLSEEDFESFRVALVVWAALPGAYTLWLSLMMCAVKQTHD